MKTIVGFLVVIGIMAIAYYFIMLSVVKVSLQISFKDFDLSNVSLQDIINGQATVKLRVNAKITNRNDFAIRLSDFHIWLYYQNTLVAQTADTENNLQKVNIPANGIVDVTHDVNVMLNRSAIDMAKDLKDGKEVRFDYTSEFKIYGVKYTYKDYFSLKK